MNLGAPLRLGIYLDAREASTFVARGFLCRLYRCVCGLVGSVEVQILHWRGMEISMVLVKGLPVMRKRK